MCPPPVCTDKLLLVDYYKCAPQTEQNNKVNDLVRARVNYQRQLYATAHASRLSVSQTSLDNYCISGVASVFCGGVDICQFVKHTNDSTQRMMVLMEC